MKVYLYTSYIVISLFFLQISFAEGTWTYFLDGNNIHALTIHGDHVYCATNAGLVIWNRLDGSYTQKMYFAETGCCQYQRTILSALAVDNNGFVWCTNGGEFLLFDGKGWSVYTVEHTGLPGGISGLIIDNNNFLWISSSKGTASYDGMEWKTYSNDETGNTITRILGVDKNNKKWFLTETGLSSFDGTTWMTYTENDGLPSIKINAMAVGPDNVIWFATKTRMIMSFDGTTWTAHEGIGWHASTIAVDNNKNVWCGTAVGLYKYDGISWDYYNYDNSSLPCNNIEALAVDSEDNLWVANDPSGRQIPDDMSVDKPDMSKGLKRFDGTNCSNWLIDGPIDYNILCIAVDFDNVKWFGSSWRGLTSFNGKKWETYTLADTTRLTHVKSVAADLDNVIWISYESEHEDRINGSVQQWLVPGIVSYDGTKWKKYTQDVTGLPNGSAYRIAVDKNNVKWFLTGSTAVSFDGITWKKYTDKEIGYILNYEAIGVDRKNMKWFGTKDNNAISFDGETWTHYPLEGARQQIHKIVEDTDNVKWFLTRNWGFYSFNGYTWNNYGFNYSDARNLLPDHSVNVRDDLDVDASGVKWFLATEFHEGFAGGGLMSFDGETWTYHRDDFWLAYAASCLAIDRDNVKWIGTHSGIARYDGGHDDVVTEASESADVPAVMKIISNFPNPFNPLTTIQFAIPRHVFVSLTIYNSAGQKVREIVSGYLSAGTHTALWDGKDDNGMFVSSGLYFSRLISGNRIATGKMLLMK